MESLTLTPAQSTLVLFLSLLLVFQFQLAEFLYVNKININS